MPSLVDCSWCSRMRPGIGDPEIWLLVFWSAWVTPFEGGQYQTREKCITAAYHQLPHWKTVSDPNMRWRCTKEKE